VLAILCLCAGLLAGCAEYKEYQYKHFNISHEQALDAIETVLRNEGYEIDGAPERNWVNDLPETYLDTDWNMRQAGSPVPGNDVRRRAYVKITTMFSDRKRLEYQPLNENDAKALEAKNEEIKKKADTESTRIGIAVRSERRSDIKRPLEADWVYEGPDSLEARTLIFRLEAMFGKGKDETPGPTERSVKLKEDQLRGGSGN
jgi:hypothetical protein